MLPENFLKSQPIEYSTIYVDMNSFFASIEQFYNPNLRGKPVGVATSPGAGGSIIAASIEAKCVGIKTGIKVAEARLICPDIAIVHDSPNSYRSIHRQIMDILHATPCYVRAKSIDEAYLKVPSYLRTRPGVINLVAGIKSSLLDLYGGHILCSVGVASNVWLAKMASNSQKPDGLVMIDKAAIAEFYQGLSLIDLTGINWRMVKNLHAIGIQNPLDFYNASWKYLNNKLGINGGKWYLRLRGFEVDIVKLKANKSISHQVTTMPNPPSSSVEITTYLSKIAITLGSRLRKKGLVASGIALYIRFLDGNWQECSFKRVLFFRSDAEIIILLKMLLKKLKITSKVTKISITLFNIVDSDQLTFNLFEKTSELQLSSAIDKINNKYGKDTIIPLSSYSAGRINLNRVGFAGDLIRETHNPTDKQHYL
ncbi:hypothetical protein EXS66_00405 [Candidatus Saccharibacteria bacterium]|nr:hypothetical protein [Candidatus Saccharibacteria bacterium]